MSSSIGDFYTPAPGTRSERYSIPLDGKHLSIGPFPFRPRSIVLMNQTGANMIAQDDRGEQYIAAQSIGATYGTGDSIRYEVWLDSPQTSGKATVLVSEEAAAVQAAQLSSFAALSEGSAANVVDRIVADTVVASDASLRQLYQLVLAGNTLGTNRVLEVRLGGTYTHNRAGGAGDTLQIVMQLNGFTIYDDTDTLGGTLSALDHPWELYFRVQNRGDAGHQQWQGHIDLDPTSTTAPATGKGKLNMPPGAWKNPPIGLGPGAYVFDTTSAFTFAMFVKWSAADAANAFALRNGYAEVK